MMCNWIALRDAQPEINRPILALAGEFGCQKFIYVARRTFEDHFYLDCDFYNLEHPWYAIPQVSHWMELPQPPEEE